MKALQVAKKLRAKSSYTLALQNVLASVSHMKTAAITALIAAACAGAQAFCFTEAGERYGVAPELLQAIAKVESSLNPRAINDRHKTATGSIDIGLMQINSSHLKRLSTWGITQDSLLNDPCLNVMVGAWLLVQHMAQHGHDWNGIGSYNASCTRLKGQDCVDARNSYSWKVYRALQRVQAARPQRESADRPVQSVAARPSIKSVDLAEPQLVAQVTNSHNEAQR
jgi:hypothetical protein